MDKNEQEKLTERAKRFQLKPTEIKNFTQDDLQQLHASLGINPQNEANIKFEMIHMNGIEALTASDILDFFIEYAPLSLEWVTTNSCNVVWSDKISAARALHFLSKAVSGMPVRDETPYIEPIPITEDENQSILLVNKNRQVQLQEDEETTSKFKNAVDISQIKTTIPPGYWRLGNKTPKSKDLLLRFTLKTDKQPFKTESFSKYLKVHGKNKNVKETTQGIFGRNKDLNKEERDPWSVLAETWDEDASFREPERKDELPKIEIKNQSLRVRLGTKRKETPLNDGPEDDDEEEIVEEPQKKIKIPRMRMYADEEEEKIKRKQMLKKIDQEFHKIEHDSQPDLRKVLNKSGRTLITSKPNEPETFDLGSTLRNRNKRMTFQIKGEDKPRGQLRETRREKIVIDEKPRPEYPRFSRDRLQEKRRRYSREYSSEEESNTFRSHHEDNKPKSKVAVVIRTQKKPTVASVVNPTLAARIGRRNDVSDSDSESSSRSSSPENEELSVENNLSNRPWFNANLKKRGSSQKAPLKIKISNDHFF